MNSSNDPIRNELGAHWVTRDKSTKNSKEPQLYYLAKSSNVMKSNNINNFALSEEIDNDEPRLPVKKVSMRIYGNAAVFKNQTQWAAFVKGGQYDQKTYAGIVGTNQDYMDHTFTVDKPLTSREAKDLGGNSRIKISDVNLEYNFYQSEYERMQRRITDEKVLPNLYALYSLKEEEELTSRNQIFKEHVSLGGLLTDNQAGQFTDMGSENPLVSNSGEYLKAFSKTVLRGSPATVFELVSTRYKNIMLSPSSIPILSYNNKKYMFPMFGEITFATDTTTQFTQILQDSNLSAVFMKDLYGSSLGSSQWKSKDFQFATHTIIPVEISNELGTTTVVNKVVAGNAMAKIWEIEAWYDYFRNYKPSQMATGIFIGKENREIQMATATDHGFYKKMMETIFVGKVRTLVKSQQRRFADVLDGDSCYSEELFYKVEKFVGDPAGEPIQTFWFANTNEVDIYNFVDTQVKYGEEYSYRASVFSLVLGSKYRYTNLSVTKRVNEQCVEFVRNGEPVAPRVAGHTSVSNISGTRTALQVPRDQRFMAEVDVTLSPHLFMTETPFFVHKSRLIDDPPLAPEIDILPYRTDSRFLKFFMQASSGEQTMPPITITPADEAMISEIRKAKNLDHDDPITYATDDFPAFFEVYRTSKPPRSYSDFAGKIRKTVSTDVSQRTPQKASGIAYVDQIRSNKKYYYMFRAIDIHNKVGAPTPVYEVEMVNDKGAFYPLVKLYNMDTTPDVTQIKAGRRFIQVIPNIEQTLINESKSGFDAYNSAKDVPGNMTYGYTQESIWNKKFKIRLTSTKTGKKIDVNLRFKTKRVKSDLEESS